MDKSEHCKEIYAYFGLAMFKAQCVESSITQMLIFCDLYEKEAKVSINQSEWEVKFDAFDQQLSAKPMGRLIRHLKSLNVIDLKTEELLKEALTRRNFLAHGYFFKRGLEFLSHSGREKMITELSEYGLFFENVEDVLNPLSMKMGKKYGLTEKVLEEILAKEKESAQCDL